MVDQHVEPVDRLLILVADAQPLSRQVLGNERQCARLAQRLLSLKTPLWQLQARVRTQAETPPDFIHTLTEEVSNCLSVLLELTQEDWWNQIRRKHDAAVFRDLNERLLEAVRGEPQFEAALSFPRAADEDRADRLADFEHLQGVLETHIGRLDDDSAERRELWKAISSLQLSEPTDVTGFKEIDRAQLTFGSSLPLGGYGTCVEAAWHGARVAVKRLLTPPRFGGGGGGGGIGGGHWGKTMPATTPVSAAAASAMRRQIRLLQSLRFDFLVPIYGACSTPPEPVSLVMPLAPHGSLHDFLHGTAVYQGGVLRRGLGSSGINGHGGVAGRNCHGGGGRGYARLSAGEKVAMAFDVARGMLHLHSHGFLHGSLKSKNVMIFDNKRLMVSDYGLLPLKELEAEENSSSGRKGRRKGVRRPSSALEAGEGDGSSSSTVTSVAPVAQAGAIWTAPEVVEGEPHSEQSDLYSYGGVIYELLAEKLPPAEAVGRRAGTGLRLHGDDSVDSLDDILACDEAGTWVPKVPMGAEAHPGQVQLMQRCLRRESCQRPGGFYVVVSFLHDLVKSLGGDERRIRAEAAMAAVSTKQGSPSEKVLVCASGASGSGTASGTTGQEGSKDWERRERRASHEEIQAARETQARLERQLAASEARCAELEASRRNVHVAATSNDGTTGIKGGSSSGAGSSGTNEGVNSEGTSTTVSGENQASNASNKKNRGGLDKNREVEGRSAVSVEQDHEERKDEEVGEKVRREVLAARLLQAEDRERQLRQTLDEVNGREHAMRSQLEHGRAGARELRTQLKEGRRREEELRVANAMLTVRSSEIVEAVVAAAPKPMNASREGRNGGGGGRLPAGNGVRNGHNVELSGKEGTKLEQLMKKLQEREKGMVAELEAERQARARLERLLQDSSRKPKQQTMRESTRRHVSENRMENDSNNNGHDGAGTRTAGALPAISARSTTEQPRDETVVASVEPYDEFDSPPPPAPTITPMNVYHPSRSAPSSSDGLLSTARTSTMSSGSGLGASSSPPGPEGHRKEKNSERRSGHAPSSNERLHAITEPALGPHVSSGSGAGVSRRRKHRGSPSQTRAASMGRVSTSNGQSPPTGRGERRSPGASSTSRGASSQNSSGARSRGNSSSTHDAPRERRGEKGSTSPPSGVAPAEQGISYRARSTSVGGDRDARTTHGGQSLAVGKQVTPAASVDASSEASAETVVTTSSAAMPGSAGKGRKDKSGGGGGGEGAEGSGTGKSGTSSSRKSSRKDMHQELKKERHLRKQLFLEKSRAEAELAQLRVAFQNSTQLPPPAFSEINGNGAGLGKRNGLVEDGEGDHGRSVEDDIGGKRVERMGIVVHNIIGTRSEDFDGEAGGAGRDDHDAGVIILPAAAQPSHAPGISNASSVSTAALSTATAATATVVIGPSAASATDGTAHVHSTNGNSSGSVLDAGNGMLGPDKVSHPSVVVPGALARGLSMGDQQYRRQQQWQQQQLQMKQQLTLAEQGMDKTSSGMLAAYPLPLGLAGREDRHIVPLDGGDGPVLNTIFMQCHGERWLRCTGWATASDVRHGVAWSPDGIRITKLELGSNRLAGHIPKEIGALSRLVCLRLDQNQILGVIPPEIGLLSALQQLELQGNQLTGSIPKELGDLSSLRYLGLHENQLLGEIPKELGKLSKLQHLALCNNRLTGTIPEELGDLAMLEKLYLNHNELSGPVPCSVGHLFNLNKLRLESNKLRGTIPMELGNLQRLQYVNLGYNGQGNCFTGEIPIGAFAKMPVLTWLSITDNPGLAVKKGRFGSTTLSLLKKSVPAKCDVYL